MHIDTISSKDLSRGVVDGAIAVYKGPGDTPLETLLKLKARYPLLLTVPLSYAGRLDPLAEGVLLVLSGKLNLERKKYLGLDKSYIVKVVFGVTTDTGDVLGLITKTSKDVTLTEQLLNKLATRYIGEYTDLYPIYSSKTVQGIPLFEWAKSGRISQIQVPAYTSYIYSIKFSDLQFCNPNNLLNEIHGKIDSVKGDFRQGEVKDSWNNFFSNNQVLICATMAVSCASGVYMRGLVNKIAEAAGSCAIALHIQRTSVAHIQEADCIRLS